MASDRYAHLRGTPLTSLDRELLQFIVEGMSYSEISAYVDRSLDTVKHRAVRLYARMGVTGKREAAAKAYGMEGFVVDTESDNRQLRATIAGLRAKVLELQDKLDASERELGELKALMRGTGKRPVAWLDSPQGRL